MGKTKTKTKKLAHLWDASRCIHCGACIVACNATNYPEMLFREEKGWGYIASNIRTVEMMEEWRKPQALLIQCQHCENAPCATACPTGATRHDENGLVILDERLCIGCAYCVTACPYNVRWMHPDTGLPLKCMGKTCHELVAKGEKPACVAVCPTLARDFGDISDPNSSISQRLQKGRVTRLLEEKGTEPKYFVVEG